MALRFSAPRLCAAVLVPLVSFACQSGPGTRTLAAVASADPLPALVAVEDEPPLAERIAAKAREVEAARRERGYAKTEIELAEMKRETELAAGESAVQGAERELAKAERALVAFELSAEASRLEVELALERAANSLEVAETDLAGILDIYAEEKEARAREEIIRRHRASVAFAKRRVEIAEIQKRKKLDHDLPIERDGLRWASDKAQIALAKAKAELKHTQLASDLEVTRKTDAEVALKQKIKDLEVSLKRLRKSKNDKKSDKKSDDK
ncbi:MAG: hypothetical protein GY711_15650 [bacterium]|nr:hypothetical protein [bacterium]